ncbi:putative inorganic phosphate transporter 1-3 [Wickerhamiella sorbophila]|uniref:Putative inorganic phosphate transporter 1-3 n=1 Tax=Wickerhamiella sorbophila TaxID=45607 RepID=A0A2T0FPZ5_9ASCO|nr:putative inorganic phosphate transporter 1-3 [Wickerhamiella sorbophila]PRT57029.1 putative inorganic phosphate transporter 1-3 [Wickerhamiella sorbophila]
MSEPGPETPTDPSSSQPNKMPGHDHQHMRVHHGPMPGMIPVPSGPQEYDTIDGRFVDDETYNRYPSDKSEREIFAYLLHPRDSYDEAGTYWADLPMGERTKFIWNQETSEVKRELKATWSLFKRDPLGPVAWYLRNAVLPGAGLLLEGYVLFSIGNIKSLFANVWPDCWGKHPTVCNQTWVYAVNYLEICGIICGQILVGLIGDGIGRRWGLIQDASIMFIGLVMLTAMWGVTLNGWVICYAWSLFFYSVGVGGEYPMTATSGMERSNFNKISSSQDRLHRGRKVIMAFLMQGWGQLLNQVILIILLIVFHHGTGHPDASNNYVYSKTSVQWTFRVSFAIPAIGTLWLTYFRAYKMPAVSSELEAQKKKSSVTGYDFQSLKMVFRFFGGRVFATCGGWFANDVFFYGNKLFQGSFIKVISGSDSKKNGVMTDWLYNLINIGCSMAGYYLASFTIDTKFYGRNMMQQVGFALCFILFVTPAFKYEHYTSKEHIHEFQAMYFLSSFFNQFGPNAVTFLVAAEVFPTNVRASAHGFSAAWGKLGALLASILFNYITDQTKFYVVPWFGLAGMIITLVFLPDVTGLDLRELDRWWLCVREGRPEEYHGVAVNPRHLSLWERWTGVGKHYNPELDYKQRVDSMRSDWEAQQRAKLSESDNSDNYDIENDFNPEVHDYFVRTSPMMVAEDKEKADDELQLPQAGKE